MKLFKKKYETIECSNEHHFRIYHEGIIKPWKCVVLEDEVITYEGDAEKKHLKIMNKERAPQVLQIDTVTSIYGEQIPFQLENGIPFIRLEDEWVPSDTFDEARLQATIKMHKRHSRQEAITGSIILLIILAIFLITGDIGDWWMLTIFGVFFIISACYRLVRLHNEMQAIQAAEAAEAADTVQEDAIAAARALQAAKEE